MGFGAFEGNSFKGNSKLFFLYVQKYHTHIKCLWITKNYNLYKKLKDEGLPVNYAYNLDGIINNAIAKYIFVTWGTRCK